VWTIVPASGAHSSSAAKTTSTRAGGSSADHSFFVR
jgi:hypothetical protein